MKRLVPLFAVVILLLLLPYLLLGGPTGSGGAPREIPTPEAIHYLPSVAKDFRSIYIRLGADNDEQGIALDVGGDRDTEVVSVGAPATGARRTGNGQVLPSADGNQEADWYVQFKVDDDLIYAGSPTTRVRLYVEYLDEGTDSFSLQYDATSGGPSGDGTFRRTGAVHKTDTGVFKTATFLLCDAYFANRDLDADFRIDDHGDGAETIRLVTLVLAPSSTGTILVDSCGASPWDANPDSEAIQSCIDQACEGDTILFTSGVDSPDYQGYLIDQTVFMLARTALSDLTFTSTDPQNHALLKATGDLKGFVLRLVARSQVSDRGLVDDITLSHLDLDSGRDLRKCAGADGKDDGVDDNWGSWLPECNVLGDPWCSPGGLAMVGAMDWNDAQQDYAANPDDWSTGLLVDDVTVSNVECGTALHLDGAASIVRNSTVDTAGDHVHAPGCEPSEDDEGLADWSDGITFAGPGHVISGNTIINPSDVGIVFFGGHDTAIVSNTVRVTAGNNGAFAGIAVHPWIFGNVSGVRVTDNLVTSLGDETCGGIHAGINVGQHMWSGGCVYQSHGSAIGNPGPCVYEPSPPQGTLCPEDETCQEWAHVAQGATFTLADNHVEGAHINYLVEGLDLEGTLVESGNTSGPPRLSDWQSAREGCWDGSAQVTWGPIDRVAHHPTLPGWTDQWVHCER